MHEDEQTMYCCQGSPPHTIRLAEPSWGMLPGPESSQVGLIPLSSSKQKRCSTKFLMYRKEPSQHSKHKLNRAIRKIGTKLTIPGMVIQAQVLILIGSRFASNARSQTILLLGVEPGKKTTIRDLTRYSIYRQRKVESYTFRLQCNRSLVVPDCTRRCRRDTSQSRRASAS